MDWLSAPDYSLTRWVIERGLALIYLIAFVVAARQGPALIGERGLLPATRYLQIVGFRDAPGLFQLGFTDRRLLAVSWAGAFLAALLVLGVPQALPAPIPMLVWLVLWGFYLSIVNVGQTFFGFGWESLLLEAGFLAVFLGDDRTVAPFPILLLFRWLAFRVEFGAGLIKLRGDACWRDLTCMDYHHETQPMPNALSWYAHRMPRWFHRLEVAGNYFAQLVAPIGLLFPQPIAGLAALVMIGTQGWLVLTGNYAWLNVVTMVAAASGIPDAWLRVVLPFAPAALSPAAPWYAAVVGVAFVAVIALSYWPVRNLLSGSQAMNASFNPYHLVNTYGAFGSVTRERYEVVVEGSEVDDPIEDDWREYEFKGKPGDPRRRPPQVAPYHLRLDWLMWFAALSPGYAAGWFTAFVERLLRADRPTLRLLRRDPFDGRPPALVRARFYRYAFATVEAHRRTGAWWSRSLVGEYLRPVRLPGSRAGVVRSGRAGSAAGNRARSVHPGSSRMATGSSPVDELEDDVRADLGRHRHG